MNQIPCNYTITGYLFEADAYDLVEKCAESVGEGCNRVVLDLDGVRELTMECAFVLERAIRERFEYSGDWTLEFLNLPETVSVKLQLLGFEVVERTCRMQFPGGGDPDLLDIRDAIALDGSPESRVVVCKICENPVAVRGAGLYQCPHCGAHFQSDQVGRLTHYESLRRFV